MKIKLKSIFCASALLCAAHVFFGAQTSEKYSFTPSQNEWTAVDLPEDMRTIEGSALDLSHFIETPKADVGGRAIVSKKGTLAFENRPEKHARFKGYTLFSHYLLLIEDKEEMKKAAAEYARLMRINGYNYIRISFDILKAYKFRPRKDDIFDRIDFLFAEFKKNGIYVHLPLMWYDSGEKEYIWALHDDVKQRTIFGDPAAWQCWKETAEEQLNHVNPYTGVAWKDDPMFVAFEYYNELSIDIGREKIAATEENSRWIVDMYVEWLKAKYGTVDKMRQAWNAKDFTPWKRVYKCESFESIKENFHKNADFYRFAFEKMEKFVEFAQDVVRKTGYKGLVAQTNLQSSARANEIRARYTDFVIKNAYFSHPSNFNLENVSCTQNSSIESSGYWLSIASSRLPDRPMGITEYNHCFWNKYRYEAPALIPAYSAFQNYSFLIIHEDVVVNSKKDSVKYMRKMTPFQVAYSPALRAAEVFSSAMFMRGDVKPSKRRIDMRISKDYLQNNPAAVRQINVEQSKISMITGFATAHETPPRPALENVKVKKPDLEISPAGSSELRSEAWFQEVVDGGGKKDFDLSKFVAEMRRKNIISPDNITNPEERVFQTDTLQITANTYDKWIKISTPRTQMAAMEKSMPVDLGALKIESVSVSSTVGVCSLEKKSIAKSSRLMLAFVTLEANRRMLATPDFKDAKTLGTPPILMKNGILKAELKLDPAKKFAVYPLALNGLRREKLPLQFKDGILKIEIDNSKLPNGATSMFEIVAE